MLGKVNSSENVRQMQLRNATAVLDGANGFGQMIRTELDKSSGLQFSKHATQRAQQRGIEMTDSFMSNLEQAVEKAREKGAKDVVVISDKGAFIINVPNNTVVTTISGQEMKENIFTNIDSAVLL